MDLSEASDSTLDALTNVHNLGFPGRAPNCSNAGANTLFHNQEFQPIAATKNKKIKLKIDTTLGHAGWNSFDDRAVGPKVPFFRSAALVFIND